MSIELNTSADGKLTLRIIQTGDEKGSGPIISISPEKQEKKGLSLHIDPNGAIIESEDASASGDADAGEGESALSASSMLPPLFVCPKFKQEENVAPSDYRINVKELLSKLKLKKGIVKKTRHRSSSPRSGSSSSSSSPRHHRRKHHHHRK
jgi:hypothetical protein